MLIFFLILSLLAVEHYFTFVYLHVSFWTNFPYKWKKWSEFFLYADNILLIL